MPTVDFRLLLVTARQQTIGRPLTAVLRQALMGGAPAVQLRERDCSTRELLGLARDVAQMTSSRDAHLFINDRLDLALTLDGVGVHLRSNSLPVAIARRLLGASRLLGISTHSVDEVLRAEAEGADYVVLGPIYDTPSKRMYGTPLGVRAIEQASCAVRVPVMAIGGVTVTRTRELRDAGAFGVAVVAAILGADDVEGTTRTFLDVLARAS
jgi:thiamine-phosphate pyrophosphorylase